MLNRKITLITAAALLLSVLLFFNILNTVKLNRMAAEQDDIKSLVLEESSANRKTDDYLNNLSSKIAHDLNTTRASLGLDISDYPFKTIGDEGPVAETLEERNILIDAVDALLNAESDNKKSAMLGKFLRSSLISETLDDTDSVTEKKDNLHFEITYKNEPYITVSAGSSDDVILESFNGDELSIKTASKESVHFIRNSLIEFKTLQVKTEDYERLLVSLGHDKEILEFTGNQILLEIENNILSFSNPYNLNNITAGVKNNRIEPYFTLSTSAEKYNSIDELKNALIAELKNFDLRPDEEKFLDQEKLRLEKQIEDEDFQEYLQNLNLNISTRPREDLDYFYYDIFHHDGTRLGSFSILKKLGEVYLVDSDEVPVSSLKMLTVQQELNTHTESSLIIPENIPEIDSLYSNQDSITFLLVGNHEKNTDTMILVHADKISGKAYMIGIPRDLYWKGRKINSIFLNFGAEQFKKELSDITGLNISHYIVVDMYAFIDIVNILGGIEITLEEDLVDPTYKIRDNGEWSTLNYKKGTYNLNGIESLRVARSRHSSNDFERSKRQQQIIEAFLNKIRELEINDVNKVYGMMQVLFEYIDTDFTLVEIMSLYNNYKNVELAGKHVLSFDNILYDTYSNIYMLAEEDRESVPRTQRGAWILFPRENNWNNIRWYIRQIINGEI